MLQIEKRLFAKLFGGYRIQRWVTRLGLGRTVHAPAAGFAEKSGYIPPHRELEQAQGFFPKFRGRMVAPNSSCHCHRWEASSSLQGAVRKGRPGFGVSPSLYSAFFESQIPKLEFGVMFAGWLFYFA